MKCPSLRHPSCRSSRTTATTTIHCGKDIFTTEALTQEVIKALDKAKEYGQPFFLYMAHYAIHIPIQSDNGGLAASNRTEPLHVQNAPLNSGKVSAYEGGIREPMIVK